ncbi:hypothetical protein CO168_03115 [Candidatus Shapirobacteria bacterium CG_4_9_14_3_um_filter_36_12]|uniref:Uncharacterized protein n=1 Tax=Candidatus Shapirobacteria bacterium CG_4_9_14_3_um_filter_36_12 TaxID=1974877 RepID=A0A2M7XMJ3_9BACT|nr:MAG: hypothetical protein CO168_03115 [Candidatus Shapirobacteria bacterium CG_4_9_14_3_um_filter_36_12]
MKIAWSVKVPQGAKLKVKDGEKVEIGDIIYEFHENVIERLPLMDWQKLNSNEKKTVLQGIVKRNLVKDEILKKGSFFSNITLKSPGAGKCLGVDEFGNIELESEKDEKYFSPISAKKVRVEDDKIIFELKGVEFECDGVNQFKTWGDFSGLVVDDLEQISSLQNGQVVLIKENIDVAIKAEAVGASGLILVNLIKAKDFDDCDIPIVTMKEDEVNKLIKFVGEKTVKIWLNASSSKVLVVLE